MNELNNIRRLSGMTLVDEAVVGDLQNGYDLQHQTPHSYSDYFPTGADSNVTDDAGPASAKHGDNPMQKAEKEPVSEGNDIHKELVYKYRQFTST